MPQSCRKLECCHFYFCFFNLVPMSRKSSSDINWRQACLFLRLPVPCSAGVGEDVSSAHPWWLVPCSLAVVWSSCTACPVPGTGCANSKSMAGPCPKLLCGWYVQITSSVFILAVVAPSETCLPVPQPATTSLNCFKRQFGLLSSDIGTWQVSVAQKPEGFVALLSLCSQVAPG